MGQVIPFSKFSDYFEKQIKPSNAFLGTILDTNILISLTYDATESNEEVISFLGNEIYDLKFTYFTSVTTKQEFLDFHRRVIMTENLRDAVDEYSQIKLTRAAKDEIRKVSAALKQREKDPSHIPVFTDREIKRIKQTFTAGKHSGFKGWLDYCEAWLNTKLEEMSTRLDDLGVRYLSPKNEDSNEILSKPLEWLGATKIAERTCLSMSDSMILNIFQASKCPFLISNDFDIGYAVLADPSMKDVVMPDAMARTYRNYLFPA